MAYQTHSSQSTRVGGRTTLCEALRDTNACVTWRLTPLIQAGKVVVIRVRLHRTYRGSSPRLPITAFFRKF